VKKVSQLTGAELDYWTARADGVPANRLCFTRMSRDAKPICTKIVDGAYGGELAQFYRPSTDWAQVGPLIYKHNVELDRFDNGRKWHAYIREWVGSWRYIAGDESEDQLTAICRAVITAEFGDEVAEVRA
jgi:hypothetical protein